VWVIALFHVPQVPPFPPVSHGLSPSQLIDHATQLVGYPHPHWLAATTAWLQDSRRSQTITAVTPFVASMLACLTGIRHGDRAALAAWVLVLVGVEAAGPHVAVATFLVVIVIVFVMAACDVARAWFMQQRNRPVSWTWPYVTWDMLKQHVEILAMPVVLVLVPVLLLSTVWLDPP
jgi:hypothetical protein